MSYPSPSTYLCTCGTLLTNWVEAEHHVEPHHWEAAGHGLSCPHQDCDRGNEEWRNKGNLRTHFKSHLPTALRRTWKCERCGKDWLNRTNWRFHNCKPLQSDTGGKATVTSQPGSQSKSQAKRQLGHPPQIPEDEHDSTHADPKHRNDSQDIGHSVTAVNSDDATITLATKDPDDDGGEKVPPTTEAILRMSKDQVEEYAKSDLCKRDFEKTDELLKELLDD